MGWININGLWISRHSGQSWGAYWETREPTGIAVTITGATTATITWTDSVVLGADGYKVYADAVLKGTIAVGVQTAAITGLTADTTYVFKVVAYKGTNESTGVTASGTTNISAPTSIANCVRWYDCTDYASMTDDGGGLISQLNDKSVTADHATAAGALRPTYVANQINGLGVLRFAGGQALTNTEVSLTTDFTVITVSYQTSAMQSLIGTAVNKCLLANGSSFDYRGNTPDGVYNGNMYFNVALAYPGNETYSFNTLRRTSGVTHYFHRKERSGYNKTADPSILALKDIGGFTSWYFTKDIVEIIIYNAGLSDTNLAKVHQYLETKYNLLSSVLRPNRITFMGDSMTAMSTSRTLIYNYLNTANNWSKSRYGSGGLTATSAYAQTQCKALTKQHTTAPVVGNDIVLVWIGTNDIQSGRTPAQTEADIAALCGYFKTDGFKVVVATILPRAVSGSWTEQERLDTNILIRANWATYADALADIGNDALMGQTGDETNLTYFADGVHPTVAGHTHLSNTYFIPAINSILA